MKLKAIYIEHILATVLLIFFADAVIFSQGTDISSGKQSRFYVGINLGPSQTHIINEGIDSIAGLNSNKRNSFFASLEFGYMYSKFVGISSGLSYTPYKTQLTLDPYKNNYDTKDSENESYNRRVTGSNINEIQKIAFLNIPLCINFQVPFNNKFGMFLQSGINLLIPVSKKYTSSGTFTFTGYYPAYNVLLHDLPDYNFPSNAKSNSEGDLELKSITADAMICTGFHYFLQEKIQIALGAYYNRSLSNISKYTSPDKFQLSSDINQINSMMGGSSKANTQSVGLRLSFKYYLH